MSFLPLKGGTSEKLKEGNKSGDFKSLYIINQFLGKTKPGSSDPFNLPMPPLIKMVLKYRSVFTLVSGLNLKQIPSFNNGKPNFSLIFKIF